MVIPKEAKSWITGLDAVKKEEDVEVAGPDGRIGEAVQDGQGATKSVASCIFQMDEATKDIGDVCEDLNFISVEVEGTKVRQGHDTMVDSEGNSDSEKTGAAQTEDNMGGEVPPIVDLLDDALPDPADLNVENKKELGAASKTGLKGQKEASQDSNKKVEAKKGEKASNAEKCDGGMHKKVEGTEDAKKGEGAEVAKKREGAEREKAGNAKKGGDTDDAKENVAGESPIVDTAKKGVEAEKGDDGKANKGVDAKEGEGEDDAKKGKGAQPKKGERLEKEKAGSAKKTDGGVAKKGERAMDAKKGGGEMTEDAKKGGKDDKGKAKVAKEDANVESTNEDIALNATENPTGDSVDLTTLSELFSQQRKKRNFSRDQFTRARKG